MTAPAALVAVFALFAQPVDPPPDITAPDGGYGRPTQDITGWERSGTNLIWNFNNMYQPCVVERPGLEHPFLMWFFGWSTDDTNTAFAGCDAVFHARSRDLEKWEIWCGDGVWDDTMTPALWRPVLTAGDRPYDNWHNGDPSVVFRDGIYHMAYSATSGPFHKKTRGHLDGMLCCIMGATSADGIHWTKTAQPLMIEEAATAEAEDDTAHLMDYHRPSLMFEDGKWRLWFDYWCPPHGVCMGLAENTGEFGAAGGFKMRHNPRTPLIKTWTNPEVVKIGGLYHCFADPPGYPPTVSGTDAGRLWSTRQICEAVSEDGLHWKILGFLPPDPGVPACHVPQALRVRKDGADTLCLFYATQKGARFQLRPGEAYDYRYDAIRAWRKPLK